jgi:hypothetical protein
MLVCWRAAIAPGDAHVTRHRSSSDLRPRRPAASFPRPRASAQRPAGRLLRRPRRHAGPPRVVADAMNGLPLPPQRQHALGYPSSRETDEAIADARRAAADFLNGTPAVAFGANMTTLTFHLAARSAAPGTRATRSSSPNSTTTPTSTPGGLAKDRGFVVRTVPMRAETGTLDWDAFERWSLGEPPRRHRGGLERPRHDQRHRRATALAARTAHSSSSTPCTTRRTRSSTCRPTRLRLPRLLGLQVPRPARRPVHGQALLLAELDVPKLEPAPDTPRTGSRPAR